MVAALVSNLVPNGLLCLSGVRPSEVPALRAAYDRYENSIASVYFVGIKLSKWGQMRK